MYWLRQLFRQVLVYVIEIHFLFLSGHGRGRKEIISKSKASVVISHMAGNYREIQISKNLFHYTKFSNCRKRIKYFLIAVIPKFSELD